MKNNTVGVTEITPVETKVTKFMKQESYKFRSMNLNNLATVLITISLLTGGTETVNFDVPIHEVVSSSDVQVEYEIAESDINYLAKTLYGEARGIESKMEKAAVCWCILNRVDSDEYDFKDMKTIKDVVTAPNQFMGYNKDNPLVDELVDIAEDVLIRWRMEKDGVVEVGRVLPAEYTYFYGDGDRNWFRTDWRSKEFWDWSWDNPYEEDLNG